jgi:phosphatidylinositol-3-phosphatase
VLTTLTLPTPLARTRFVDSDVVGTPRPRTSRALGALLAAALSLSPLAVAEASTSSVPAFSHVFLIVMENRDYASALADPGVRALAARGVLATNYYGVAHPSLPNYLALVGGSTFGVRSDCVTCYVRAPNLQSQLAAAHVSFGAYLEGAPRSCFLDPWGGTDYAAKHNPFRYFLNVRSSATLCAQLHPLSALAPVLDGPASAVPRMVWITPNLCHDGHDCSTAQASAWLRAEMNAITASAAYRDGGALFVTWDEGEGGVGRASAGGASASGAGGHEVTFVLSPAVRAGTTFARAMNHYSLLATVEDAMGVARLGAARGAATFAPIFH